MTALTQRNWVPAACEARVQQLAQLTSQASSDAIAVRLDRLVEENPQHPRTRLLQPQPGHQCHEPEGRGAAFGRARFAAVAGLSGRQIRNGPGGRSRRSRVITAELCAEIFGTEYAEIRVASGAMANLYGFMATCRPGDAIIVPPASIGGHVTHHNAGCAGSLRPDHSRSAGRG